MRKCRCVNAGSIDFKPSFEGKRDHVDAMINLDNRAIQKKAYEKALKQLDPDSYKKDRQATNLLFYSAPLAAGVSRMLLSGNSKTKLFTRNISGAAGRGKRIENSCIYDNSIGCS